MTSSTVENYLKAILANSAGGNALVPMGQIADNLGVVPGTATTMIKSLAERGLIEHLPRQGVRLTRNGRQVALNVLRKHRLIETFLVSVLKMDWADVHEEAERLEHAFSDRVMERIDALLGHPSTDPHGDPIPTAQGRLDVRVYHPLSSASINHPLKLVRILDQSPEFLQFAEREGLVPGARLFVVSLDEPAGVIILRMKPERRITLGLEQAGRILVEPILRDAHA